MRIGRRLFVAVLALPVAFLVAALTGSLVPVNANWAEPAAGTTVYLRSNGVHVDLLMPARAQGLDWRPLFPAGDFADPPAAPTWFAFGAGERRVYLETPTWADITPRTLWSGLTGGERVIHVERVADPGPDLRAIRLRPEEYRRLWTSVRAQLVLDSSGRPRRIDHPGYGYGDAFFRGVGRASAISTCNVWIADQLRLAGVRTSAWTPFTVGLTWRYRKVPFARPQ